jgi:hypothetical protein
VWQTQSWHDCLLLIWACPKNTWCKSDYSVGSGGPTGISADVDRWSLGLVSLLSGASTSITSVTPSGETCAVGRRLEGEGELSLQKPGCLLYMELGWVCGSDLCLRWPGCLLWMELGWE